MKIIIIILTLIFTSLACAEAQTDCNLKMDIHIKNYIKFEKELPLEIEEQKLTCAYAQALRNQFDSLAKVVSLQCEIENKFKTLKEAGVFKIYACKEN